ncbi:MAG TPA: archease [Candidatus Polarisedimenticolia bacterium]|nr:archease [Candidatus Polarisedimenticolia bacterium]
MGEGSYSIFDHTADVGLAVEAPTLIGLFETAGTALLDLMVERPPGLPIVPLTRVEIDLTAADTEELLVGWLSELLFLHETRDLVFVRFDVRDITAGRLLATADGEPFDAGRHRMRREVKAVTYHQVTIVREGEVWRARLVLDV